MPFHYTDFPATLQLDLNNHCGMRYCGLNCIYCWPQNQIKMGKVPYAEMPMDVVEWVFKDMARYGQHMWFWCDFLNGDGLDPGLPAIRKLGKKYAPFVKSQTFTCGTRPENAELLCSKELDWINVTLSAPNDAVYRVVHRSTRFQDVLKTMRIISEKRLPHQRLEVHYVINQYNFAYMKEWLTLMKTEFPDWIPKFSPLVNTGKDDPSNQACGALSTQDQEDAIKEIGAEPFWNRSELPYHVPCLLFHNASIDVEGRLLQCCRWDVPDFYYGNAREYIENGYSFRDYWMMKLANKLRNPFCDRCNLKAPNWKQKVDNLSIRSVVCK